MDIKHYTCGAEEKAQQLKAFSVLADDPSSVPYTYMVGHNHPSLPFQSVMLPSSGL